MANVVKPNLTSTGGNINVKNYSYSEKNAVVNAKPVQYIDDATVGKINSTDYGNYNEKTINSELNDILTTAEGKIESLLSKYHIFDIIPDDSKPTDKPAEEPPKAEEKPKEETPKEEPKKEEPKKEKNKSSSSSLPADWDSPYNSRIDDQRTVYEYLKNEGYNDAAIAGIMGNIVCESGFNPNCSYKEKTGYYSNGIIQWNSQYVPKSAIGDTTEEQLDYLCHNFSGFSASEKEYLKSIPNTEAGAREAASYFDRKVEISDGSMRNQRMNYAAQYYNSFN